MTNEKKSINMKFRPNCEQIQFQKDLLSILLLILFIIKWYGVYKYIPNFCDVFCVMVTEWQCVNWEKIFQPSECRRVFHVYLI